MMFTADEARKIHHVDIDDRIKDAVVNAVTGNKSCVRIYGYERESIDMRRELEDRGFTVEELSGYYCQPWNEYDLWFEW